MSVHNIVSIIFAIISFVFFVLGAINEPEYSGIFGRTNLGRMVHWTISFILGFIAATTFTLGFFQ